MPLKRPVSHCHAITEAVIKIVNENQPDEFSSKLKQVSEECGADRRRMAELIAKLPSDIPKDSELSLALSRWVYKSLKLSIYQCYTELERRSAIFQVLTSKITRAEAIDKYNIAKDAMRRYESAIQKEMGFVGNLKSFKQKQENIQSNENKNNSNARGKDLATSFREAKLPGDWTKRNFGDRVSILGHVAQATRPPPKPKLYHKSSPLSNGR
eukprot:scaffold2345_cov158-Ochromonas_danica.AAC.1